MKQIKFRAWDTDHKKWLFSYKQLGGFSLFGETIMLGEWEAIPLSKLNSLAVTQFTGIKDKNDKEIYEGDVISATFVNSDKRSETIRKKVMYEEKFGRFSLVDLPVRMYENTSGMAEEWIKAYDYEVIGNIYENPELGHIPVPQPQNSTGEYTPTNKAMDEIKPCSRLADCACVRIEGACRGVSCGVYNPA